MKLSDPGLNSQTICLEMIREEHREALRQSNAVEYMWMSLPAIQRGAGFDAYFDYTIKTGGDGIWVPFALLDPNQNDKFVGVTAYIKPNRTHRRVSIGYTWLDPELRGLGIYAAIQKLMIQRALDWGARRISWPIEADNERAIRAVKGLGATHEGVLRNYERFADGQWVDIAILSMLRDEAKSAVMKLDATLTEAQT